MVKAEWRKIYQHGWSIRYWIYASAAAAAVEGLKMDIEPLGEVSEIIQADGEPLKLLGPCRIFLESDDLGGRRIIYCAVLNRGKRKETIISIDYLKKWNLLYQTVPIESVDDYIERKYLNNKYSAYNTSLSNKIESTCTRRVGIKGSR